MPTSAGGGERQEFYRGVYRSCLETLAPFQDRKTIELLCHHWTAKAVDENWYEAKSRGWKWPLK